MGVASWSWLSGLFMGLGRLGGCSCGMRAAGRVSWVCCSRVWLVVCVGIGDTPAVVVGRCGCCGRGGLLVVGALACFVRVGGGMLSGFWGSAPWLPGLWFCFAVVGWGCGCGWVGCELYSGREHYYCIVSVIVACGLFVCVFCRVLLFVFLSVRWMPWHQGPMKDVVACDIPRGAGWRAVIRGFPNGGTRHELCRVTCI